MAKEISVYPNPFDYYIILEITCDEEIDCIILLADITEGRIVRMLGAGLRNGINRIPLNDLQLLIPGTYQLNIKTSEGESIYQTKVFKQSDGNPTIHLN
ncbi:T9SS type A sorting domain-containing protein [Puia sp. P3]|uniref:T9SS type A sorting domain-containing protein n=1 Tax=Puia sp. P3 TaxID=3423952 RepID=UPI003D678FA7